MSEEASEVSEVSETGPKSLCELAAEHVFREYARKRPLEAARALREVLQKVEVTGAPLEDDDILEVRLLDQTQEYDVLQPKEHVRGYGDSYYEVKNGKHFPEEWGPYRILAKDLQKELRSALSALAELNPALGASVTLHDLDEDLLFILEWYASPDSEAIPDLCNGWKEAGIPEPDEENGVEELEHYPGTDVDEEKLNNLNGAYEQIQKDWNVDLPEYVAERAPSGFTVYELYLRASNMGLVEGPWSAPFKIVGTAPAPLLKVLDLDVTACDHLPYPEFPRFVNFMQAVHAFNQKTYKTLRSWVVTHEDKKGMGREFTPPRDLVEEARLEEERAFKSSKMVERIVGKPWPEELRGTPRMYVQLVSSTDVSLRRNSEYQIRVDWLGRPFEKLHKATDPRPPIEDLEGRAEARKRCPRHTERQLTSEAREEMNVLFKDSLVER